MRVEHMYFVYIVASRSRNSYIGVTNGLLKRIEEHQSDRIPGFTATYRVHRLVYSERFGYIDNAIAREKELKRWVRAKKLALIHAANPTWVDLYDELINDPHHSPALAFTRVQEPGV